MNEGYLDAITNSYFKERDDGTKLFYPQGAIGRLGYIVPSAELEERLRTSARRFFVGSMIGGTLLGSCFGEFASSLQEMRLALFVAMLPVIFGPLAWLGAKGFFWPFTQQMTAVHEANSFKRSWLAVVQTLHPWFVGLTATVCFLIVVASIVSFQSSGEPKLLLLSAIFYRLVCALDARCLDSRAVEKNRALMSTPGVERNQYKQELIPTTLFKAPENCACVQQSYVHDVAPRFKRDHVVKAVDGELILHFKIRRTNVVVRFDEENRVKHCYEHFDIN